MCSRRYDDRGIRLTMNLLSEDSNENGDEGGGESTALAVRRSVKTTSASARDPTRERRTKQGLTE